MNKEQLLKGGFAWTDSKCNRLMITLQRMGCCVSVHGMQWI